MIWRPMRADDLTAVCAISDAVHGAYTEDRSVYAERLALYPDGCFVLDGADGVLGYLISHPWHRNSPPALNVCLEEIPADAESYYLHDIALLPSARGTGAGAEALKHVVTHAKAAGFGDVTLMAVNGADRYWAARGFEAAEMSSPASYGPGSVLMRRTV
jgi:GNAT superfamily N-acetyltransferase